MSNDFTSEHNGNDMSLMTNLIESSVDSPPIRNVEAGSNDTSTGGFEEEEEATDNDGYRRNTRRRTSKVWEDFEEHKVGDTVMGVRGKHCWRLFKQNKLGTTSQYARHLKTCPKHRVIISGQPHLNLQRATLGSSNPSNIVHWKYDQARIREMMSHMVMVHELPFAFAKYEMFNLLMKDAAPEFKKVSRNTLKADCGTSYHSEKKRLMNLLSSVKRVFITTDIWRSAQKIEYMVVTCHFVSDWKLHKRVLNFCHIPPPHNGAAVCDILNQCLNEWNLTNKLATVTMDNASYNDSAIRKLKDVLSHQIKLPFDGRFFFHVRCCAHIVNILVQDGLAEIGDIVHNIRETVKHIDKTSHRIKLFGDVVRSWHLPGKKLILDCPTRWNSTYQMLSCALDFKDVFGDYEEKDSSYKNKPLDTDWIMVEKIRCFLKIFNDITEVISGTEYPTSNLFLSELAQIKEELEEKSKSEDDYIRGMANKMKSKFEKYWGSNNCLISVAAVLDPRSKMKAVQFYSKALYESDFEAAKYISMVKGTLEEIYNEYVEVELNTHGNYVNCGGDIQAEGIDSATNTNIVGKGKVVTTGRGKFHDYIRGSNSNNLKSELDTNLEDGLVDTENMDPCFDPLDWWRGNSLKYQILSKLACDILAIPITYVASQSTFSAGSRVIDSYRASLGVDTVQMLLCGGDWLRKFYGIKKRRLNDVQDMKEILF